MKAISRISWSLTLAGLLAGRLGWEPGIFLAAGIAGLHAMVLAAIFGRRAFLAVQVRGLFATVALLAAAFSWPALHWLQMLGMSALLLFDYCLAARLLMLLPWNRSTPFSMGLVRRTLVAYPLHHAGLSS